MAGYDHAFLRGDPLLRRAARFGKRIARGVARRVAARVGSRVTHALIAALPARGGGAMRIDPALALTPARSMPDASRAPTVIHAIGSLGPGGAERQLAVLACGLHARGRESHSVLTIAPLEGPSAHYLERVRSSGLDVAMAGGTLDPTVRSLLRWDRATREALACMPTVLRPLSLDLAGEFLARRPDILHAWLDQTNICAGIAALATGVPRIVLSLRGMNPTQYPMLHRSWMIDGYRALAACPRVRLVANSSAGAADYAQWIGIESARISVIHNGLDPAEIGSPLEATTIALRHEFAPHGEKVVLGVLRLSEEKCPLLFVEAARRVLARVRDCRVILVGDGPLASQVARAASDLGPRFRVLARRTDIADIMSASDALMLTSRVEGTPNVLLEAQWLGIPVVSTAAGGAVDAIDDSASGFLCLRGDAEALAVKLTLILTDDALRARMSLRARAFVRERFSLDAMLDASQRLYD